MMDERLLNPISTREGAAVVADAPSMGALGIAADDVASQHH